MVIKRRYVTIALAIVSVLLGSLLVNNIILGLTGEYDPWIDINDDGVIDINDLQALALTYGASGIPINKTERLLELEARLDSLNATLLTGYYNKSDSDDRFVNVPGDTMTGALTVPHIYDRDNTVYYVNPAGSPSALFAGNVGIGTTSPLYKLEVGNPSESYNYVRVGSSTWGGILFYDGDGTHSGGVFYYHGDDSMQFQTKTSGGSITEKMRITSDGNVGIGTTSPLARLHATGGAYGVRGGGTSYGGYFRDTDGTSYAYLGYGIYGIYSPYKAYFGGNVGIGTTSPQARLHATGDLIGVFGEGSQYGAYFEGNYGTVSYGSTMGGYFQDTDGFGTAYLGYGSWGIYTPNDAYFGGRVGIGTTTPTMALVVAGYVQAYGYVTGDIIFQEDGEKLWRMYEEEDGLYLENLKTSKVYSFVLQEVESGKLVESNNSHLKPSGVHANITQGAAGLVIALGVVLGLIRYRAKNNKEEPDAQQSKLSQWQ